MCRSILAWFSVYHAFNFTIIWFVHYERMVLGKWCMTMYCSWYHAILYQAYQERTKSDLGRSSTASWSCIPELQKNIYYFKVWITASSVNDMKLTWKYRWVHSQIISISTIIVALEPWIVLHILFKSYYNHDILHHWDYFVGSTCTLTAGGVLGPAQTQGMHKCQIHKCDIIIDRHNAEEPDQ